MPESSVPRLALAGLFLALRVTPVWGEPSGENLLPVATCGFVSVSHMPKFLAAWEKTLVAGLFDDATMKPFLDAAQIKVNRGEVLFRVLLGLTPKELGDVTSGEAVVALVADGQAPPAIVILLDVGGREDKADKLLAKLGRRLVTTGAVAGTESVGPSEAAAYTLPAVLNIGTLTRCLALRQGNWLVVSSQLSLLRAVLHRLAGEGEGGNLGGDRTFRATVTTVQEDLSGFQVRWFIRPIEFLFALRELTGEVREETPDYLAALRDVGFRAILGFGGAARLTAGDEVEVRAVVLAPKPYQKAMRMLDLPNARFPNPPDWVPSSAGAVSAVSINIPQAFDAYGPLFDALNGGGEQGVFDDVVKGLRDDPDGPRVDLRNDAVGNLKPLCWTCWVRPDRGGRMLGVTGVAVSAEQPLAEALKRLFEGDEQVKPVRFGANGAWQIVQTKTPEGRPEGHLVAPSLTTLTVSRDTFFACESPDALTVLAAPALRVADAVDYKEMMSRLEKRSATARSLQGFGRGEDTFQDFWHELRNGGPRGVQPARRVFKYLFMSKAEKNELPFDTNLLPEFETVRKHTVARYAYAGVTRDDGWQFVFLVHRP